MGTLEKGNAVLIAKLPFSFHCLLHGHELHWWDYYGDGANWAYAYCPYCTGLFVVPMNYDAAQLYGFKHWSTEPFK